MWKGLQAMREWDETFKTLFYSQNKQADPAGVDIPDEEPGHANHIQYVLSIAPNLLHSSQLGGALPREGVLHFLNMLKTYATLPVTTACGLSLNRIK